MIIDTREACLAWLARYFGWIIVWPISGHSIYPHSEWLKWDSIEKLMNRCWNASRVGLRSTRYAYLTSGSNREIGSLLPGKLFSSVLCETHHQQREVMLSDFFLKDILAWTAKNFRRITMWFIKELVLHSRSYLLKWNFSDKQHFVGPSDIVHISTSNPHPNNYAQLLSSVIFNVLYRLW